MTNHCQACAEKDAEIELADLEVAYGREIRRRIRQERDLRAKLAAAEQREAEAFRAGWHAAIDQTDKFGETHETPDEAWAFYLASRRADVVGSGCGPTPKAGIETAVSDSK